MKRKMSKGFRNVKIHISSPEECEAVQKALFALGCEWNAGGQAVQYLDSGSLYVDKNGKMSRLPSQKYEDFCSSPRREVFVREVLKAAKAVPERSFERVEFAARITAQVEIIKRALTNVRRILVGEVR